MGTVLGILLSPHGRMNRQEFATAFFGSMALLLILGLCDSAPCGFFSCTKDWSAELGGIFLFEFFLWKYIAIVALVKRLHDMDYSGMLWLVIFIPFVGLIVYLVALF